MIRCGKVKWFKIMVKLGYSRGQNISEYVILVAVISAAIISTQTYTKRGIQGVVKSTADYLHAGIPAYAGGAEPGLFKKDEDPIRTINVKVNRRMIVSETPSGKRTTTTNNDVTNTQTEENAIYLSSGGRIFE